MSNTVRGTKSCLASTRSRLSVEATAPIGAIIRPDRASWRWMVDFSSFIMKNALTFRAFGDGNAVCAGN